MALIKKSIVINCSVQLCNILSKRNELQYLQMNNSVFQFYFRKTPAILHQQNFWWFRFFLIRRLPRYLKNIQTETTERFLVGNTKIDILTNQG